ncbi:hypothetical protein Ocin01_06423 [Orchesella cincta]|uniref:Uncharacterized protein n=1 Tax=Orchesella cincta TaxID=48709 RepID=A0A1D2N4S6_ORCCI|nr:hypothetical protein Ocin01_06423 [Orchesella cincta]
MSTSNLYVTVSSVLFLTLVCSAQNFDPSLSDKEYLDKIQDQLHQEAVEAHINLVNQTKILQQVTRSFIASKIKENLFRAIRAEVESQNATNTTTPRQGRQDDGDAEEEDGSTTARPRPPGLLPQLANVVTAIFGPNVNVTEYVQSASSFLPGSVSNQLVDAIRLIDPARFTSSTPPPSPTPAVVVAQFITAPAANGTSSAYAPIPPYTNSGGGSLTPGVLQQSNAAQLFRNPPASTGIGANANSAPSNLQQFPTVTATVKSSTADEEDDDGSKNSVANKNSQDEEDNSGEPDDDEFADDIFSDDKGSSSFGPLEEYAAIKYAIGIYKRLTRNEIPTTTEFMNTTTALPEYEDDVEKRPKTTPPPSTRYQTVVKGGMLLYEGAREAYMLLQHINRYLDRVNVQFETAGFGAEEVVSGAKVDSHFAVDTDDIQLREIADNVKRVTGAMMGLAEYVLEIKQELRSIRADLSETKPSNKTTARPITYYSKPVRDPEEVRRQSLELADKVERLLAMEQSPQVDLAKEELKRTVEKNFLRMLAAILVTGPAHTQERSDDIFKLMRSVLNGEMDFTPVVERLPLILRDTETNQFVNLLITLRESEQGGSFRQGILNSVENTVTGNNRPINRPIRPINGQVNVPIDGQYVGPTGGQYVGPTGGQFNGVTNGQYVGTGTGQFIGSNNGQFNGPLNRPVGSNPAGINQGQFPGVTQNPNQTNQLPSINSLIEAMTQTQQLIKEIPNLVEGLQTLVESLEGLFG